MGKRGLTIGLLVASCAMLASALTLAWTEIQEYKHGPREPEVSIEAPAGEPAAGAAADVDRLTSLIPPNAIGVMQINVSALRQIQLGDSAPDVSAELPLDPATLELISVFGTPLNGTPQPAGAAIHTATQEQIRTSLTEAGATTLTVQGVEAFQTDEGFVAPIEEGLLLMADTELVLGDLITRHRQGGEPPADLVSALQSYQTRSIRWAAVLNDTLRGQLAAAGGDRLPESLRAFSSVAGGIQISAASLSIEVRLTYDSAEAAEAARSAAQNQLDQAPRQISAQMEGAGPMAPMLQTVQSILDQMSITAEGPDLTINTSISASALRQAIEAMSGAMLPGAAAGGSESPFQPVPMQ